MVPCSVTRPKYQFESNIPSGAASEPKIDSKIENWVSGHPSFILNKADKVIPIAPIKMAVSKYCLPIIL